MSNDDDSTTTLHMHIGMGKDGNIIFIEIMFTYIDVEFKFFRYLILTCSVQNDHQDNLVKCSDLHRRKSSSVSSGV